MAIHELRLKGVVVDGRWWGIFVMLSCERIQGIPASTNSLL